MLRPEVAEKQLKALHDESWSAKRRRALAGLAGTLGKAGQQFLAEEGRYAPWLDADEEEAKPVRDAFAKATARDRRKLFDLMFPKLGEHVEAGWQLHGQLPYQTGYERKGFRAPSDPGLTLPARVQWLADLVDRVQGYNQDLAWLAAWAPHLSGGYGADALGILFAAAIEQGGAEGDQIYDILCASARGEHDIGGMGRHVTRALLVANRPEGWEFMERMLLAAQRQEGLRQSILESIDEAHPEAFRRMVRLILEHDLARFSAVVRALNVWFGFAWDSVSVKVVNETLSLVLTFLEDEAARTKAMSGKDGNALYLALWALGFEDAAQAVGPAAELLDDRNVERRFVGAIFLGQLRTPAACAKLRPAVADEDVRVALAALGWLPLNDAEVFEDVEGLLARLPEQKTKLQPLVWPWTEGTANAHDVARRLVEALGDRPPTRLLPHLARMDGYGRAAVVEKLAKQRKWDAATRDTLFELVGDSTSWTRQKALEALASCRVNAEEAVRLEGYLTRKVADLRRAAVVLLLSQDDAAALASTDRLLASSDPLQRLGGLEVLRQLAEAKRSPETCRQRAEAYRAARQRRTPDEEKQIAAVLDSGRTVYTVDDALGLMNPAERSCPEPPKKRGVTFLTPATLALLQGLDELVHAHRDDPVTIETWQGPKEELLGSLEWQLPVPDFALPLAEDAARLPLRDLWETWLRERPEPQRDKDGQELLRANVWCEVNDKVWKRQVKTWGESVRVFAHGLKPVALRYEKIVSRVLGWLVRLSPPAGGADFVLNATETAFALVPRDVLTRRINPTKWEELDKDWRQSSDPSSPFLAWLELAQLFRNFCPQAWSGDHHNRLWRLLRWLDEPAEGVHRQRPELEEVLAAWRAGGATEADVFEHLLGPREERWFGGMEFDELRQLTPRKPPKVVQENPALGDVLDRCRARILDIELDRGDTPTAASAPALELQSMFGVDTLERLLRGLGPTDFFRGYRSDTKPGVLSHLISVTYPAEDDIPEIFADRVCEAGVDEARLIVLAFHAPQWVRHIEPTLGWPSFAEGVWWFIAHTRYGDPGEDRDAWAKLIGERTPLTPEELEEGAVDVAWFQRVYAAVGPRRWDQLRDAAKYACHAQGHKQALLLSDVLLGKTDKADLVANIRQKQRRESVRLLGLLPLANGKARDRDVRERYEILHEYLAYARKLSAMTKTSALRAHEIGLHNLARTAGYADPLRFEWAMEAEAVADLARGPVRVTVSGVEVTLAVDDQGQPEVTVSKAGKPLKAIPPAVKKNAKVAALIGRRQELKKQAGRIRLSLEQMMCRGDSFTAEELRTLLAHPLLRPLLERLVLIGEGVAGYPVAGGKGLRDHAGRVEPVKKGERLRIAHAHDLLQTKAWDLWQHEAFTAERVQPFKQVFRELYVVTGQERADGNLSRRYAGQQVNPKQATALWGARGWAVNEEEGVRRTFHDAGLSAWVTIQADSFTPAEVDGWTLEEVRFSKRGTWEPLPLVDIPPRIFSEVMRDLDLVVSVAHRGGVDPEASASTVEMRAALLRETCALLKLDNVRTQGAHVLIDGQLAHYSVHLGSAVVHRQPGGHLCIVPVHAAHRGRLFLPFADDDPKTAEVLSKVLLLARDAEIQDPTILDQIRS